MNYCDILNEFIIDLSIRNYSNRTIKNYKNNNLLFANWLKNEQKVTSIEEVTIHHIKAYILYMKSKNRKPNYINEVIRTIRVFFHYCVEEDYIETNPLSKIKLLKVGNILINTFNDNEAKAMLKAYKGNDYLSIRNRTIIYVLFDMGLRANEVCNIRMCDVFDSYIKINQSKGLKSRLVSFSPITHKLLMKYNRCRHSYFLDRALDNNSYYFLSYRANKLTIEAIETIVSNCGKVANVRTDIRCSPHTIRHYYAQSQLRNGLDIYSLSRLLGHSDINITKRYLQSINDNNIVAMTTNTNPLTKLL